MKDEALNLLNHAYSDGNWTFWWGKTKWKVKTPKENRAMKFKMKVKKDYRKEKKIKLF
jgi:hypothetical protein